MTESSMDRARRWARTIGNCDLGSIEGIRITAQAIDEAVVEERARCQWDVGVVNEREMQNYTCTGYTNTGYTNSAPVFDLEALERAFKNPMIGPDQCCVACRKEVTAGELMQHWKPMSLAGKVIGMLAVCCIPDYTRADVKLGI